MDGYISKPVGRAELIEAMALALSSLSIGGRARRQG